MFELAETLYDAGYEYMLMRTLTTCFGCRPALVGRALIGDAVSLTPEALRNRPADHGPTHPDDQSPPGTSGASQPPDAAIRARIWAEQRADPSLLSRQVGSSKLGARHAYRHIDMPCRRDDKTAQARA